jgi:response regulator RpfG family c-di-GMP phosphodiesterase
MNHILLVDDDDLYRSALSNILKPLGFEITEAADGDEARQILSQRKFDLLISDIRMPKCDGVQLLRWTKGQSRMPVILITGFAEILETTTASELGADGFLSKPFKFDEIKALIDDVLHGKATILPDVDIDDQFCKVPLEDFVSGSQINFSVFHRLTKNKYIKIAHRGEDIESVRIVKYKNKGLRNLYLAKEDFAKYVGFNLELAKRLEASSKIPMDRKINFLRYTAELVMEQMYVDGSDKDSFECASDFAQTTLRMVQEQPESFMLLESLNQHANHVYAHCLGVSIYGVMIARELGWHWGPTLYKISMAGLFHDIGLKEIPIEIVEKPRFTMSQSERTLYETHPQRGMELLNQIPGTIEDVILTAYQHQEDCLGKGYPQTLPRQRIIPIARLIAVADAFCEYTIFTPGIKKLAATEAVTQMIAKGRVFDSEYMDALKRIFKIADDQENKKPKSA